MPGKSIFSRLHRIVSEECTHDNWQKVQPCWNIKVGNRRFILTQPFSSFLVYVLGVETVIVAFLFLENNAVMATDMWWFISLFLWGLGAVVAGTSYQAFGYYIKCYGKEVCSWTSWWEIVYLLMQKLSCDAMVVAVGLSCIQSSLSRTILFAAVGSSALVYTAILIYGSLKPIKRLITFELMVQFCTPIYVFLIALNGYRFIIYKERQDGILFGLWISLVIIMLAYYAYMNSGLTKRLWKQNRWFSENDVLHVGLIVWMAVTGWYLPN